MTLHSAYCLAQDRPRGPPGRRLREKLRSTDGQAADDDNDDDNDDADRSPGSSHIAYTLYTDVHCQLRGHNTT